MNPVLVLLTITQIVLTGWLFCLWQSALKDLARLEEENVRLLASRTRLMADLHQADAAVKNHRRLVHHLEAQLDRATHTQN